MTIAKVGLAAAALAAFVGLGVNGASAAPLPAGGLLPEQTEIVRVQYFERGREFEHDRGRHYGWGRRVCRTEWVQRWVHGRPVRERVERCFVRR